MQKLIQKIIQVRGKDLVKRNVPDEFAVPSHMIDDTRTFSKW